MQSKKDLYKELARKTLMEEIVDDDYDRILHINIDLIKENPYQPRKVFDETSLIELSKSILDHGIIQPVIVRKKDENEYILIAGERRIKASMIAGLKTVPAVLSGGNPLEISLIENLQRENLTAIETAEAMQEMVNKYGYKHEKLSQLVGKSRSRVTQILSINKLPREIRDKYRSSQIQIDLLVRLSREEDLEKIERLLNDSEAGQSYRSITKQGKKQSRNKFSKIDSYIGTLSKINGGIKKMEFNESEVKKYIALIDSASSLINALEEKLKIKNV